MSKKLTLAEQKIREEKNKERNELLRKLQGNTYYTEDKTVKCFICGKEFTVPNNYDPPIYDSNFGAVYSCKKCSKILKDNYEKIIQDLLEKYHLNSVPIKFLRKWARDAVLKKNGLL